MLALPANISANAWRRAVPTLCCVLSDPQRAIRARVHSDLTFTTWSNNTTNCIALQRELNTVQASKLNRVQALQLLRTACTSLKLHRFAPAAPGLGRHGNLTLFNAASPGASAGSNHKGSVKYQSLGALSVL